MTAPAVPAAAYERLARPDATFSMVAIDQRDTLRRLLRAAGQPDHDQALRDFKAAVMDSLAGAASAVLTDAEFGLPAARAAGLGRGTGPGLILTADQLFTDADGRLTDSVLDETVLSDPGLLAGADALKFLVLWPDAADRARRDRALDAIGRFVERCAELGLLAVVETIIAEPGHRLDTAQFDAALTDAALACAQLGPGLYKTQVPGRGQQDPARIQAVSEQITVTLPCPWVVLSAGVPAADFPGAVQAACAGGASGFLCGQAVWGPSIKASAPLEDLRTAAADRLATLAAVASRAGRPWPDALARGDR